MIKQFIQVAICFGFIALCAFAQSGDPLVSGANRLEASVLQIVFPICAIAIIFALLSAGFTGGRAVASLGVIGLTAWAMTHAEPIVHWVASF